MPCHPNIGKSGPFVQAYQCTNRISNHAVGHVLGAQQTCQRLTFRGGHELHRHWLGFSTCSRPRMQPPMAHQTPGGLAREEYKLGPCLVTEDCPLLLMFDRRRRAAAIDWQPPNKKHIWCYGTAKAE
ncbi:unnamed protein product [Clonostachys byssicola]|uniref:Uncharacterized protein n=1 Tax=Clonostachys byssicola TaxID=160290 RepID=A0A9N9Y5Y2_9HYPO|nr:unnamed protein product [Clonostachys byssicola]